MTGKLSQAMELHEIATQLRREAILPGDKFGKLAQRIDAVAVLISTAQPDSTNRVDAIGNPCALVVASGGTDLCLYEFCSRENVSEVVGRMHENKGTRDTLTCFIVGSPPATPAAQPPHAEEAGIDLSALVTDAMVEQAGAAYIETYYQGDLAKCVRKKPWSRKGMRAALEAAARIAYLSWDRGD